jgi:hypothetical protein
MTAYFAEYMGINVPVVSAQREQPLLLLPGKFFAPIVEGGALG